MEYYFTRFCLAISRKHKITLIRFFNRFDANSEKDLIALIFKNKINLNLKGIVISEATKDLLRKMLNPDPAKRIEWVDLF